MRDEAKRPPGSLISYLFPLISGHLLLTIART
jgi:hypothetical protein